MNRRTFMKTWAALVGAWSTLTTVSTSAAPLRPSGRGRLSFERFQVRWFVYNLVPVTNVDHHLSVLVLPTAPKTSAPGQDPRTFPVNVETRFEHDGPWMWADIRITVEQTIQSWFYAAGMELMTADEPSAYKPSFRYLYQNGPREVMPTDVLETVIEFESDPIDKRRWLKDSDYRDSLHLSSGAELEPKGKEFLQRIIDRGMMSL